jgi:hypothetical protein
LCGRKLGGEVRGEAGLAARGRAEVGLLAGVEVFVEVGVERRGRVYFVGLMARRRANWGE